MNTTTGRVERIRAGSSSHRRAPQGMLHSRPHRQRGLGILGMLVIASMVGFFVLAGIRILPGYLEYMTVRDIAIRVAGEFDEERDTIADIRRTLAGYFNTNQVKSIDYREVEIKRKDGRIMIDAGYEQRIPLLWRIDAVVKYNDLVFEAGVDYTDRD